MARTTRRTALRQKQRRIEALRIAAVSIGALVALPLVVGFALVWGSVLANDDAMLRAVVSLVW